MKTKDNIIEISTELMKCYGLKSITMSDISEKAGISKKTLYQFVSDKNELINTIIENQYFKMKAELAKLSAQSSNSVEELIRINLYIVHFLQEISPVAIFDLKKYYPEISTRWTDDFKSLFSEFIISNIKKGKEDLNYRNDINEELISKLHVEHIDKLQEAKQLWGSEASSPDVIKDMTNYYIRGLITEKGEKLLNMHILEFTNYLNK